MEAPDEQLMLAYRDGDAGAFETLYRRHRGALYRFVLRGVKNRATAEELYQEIWIRVIEARARYEPQARFTTWLYTIAHNRMVDHWRKKEIAAIPLEENLSASAIANPERLAQGREALARLARAIDELPQVQREAFLLHEEGGLTISEIAAVTGAGEEAAKSRLRYAIAKLKAAVDDG